MQAAEHPVEGGTQSAGVLVSGGAASGVVLAGAASSHGAEGPHEAGRGEALVCHLSVVHDEAPSRGSGDGC
jgi:hypothetical protein